MKGRERLRKLVEWMDNLLNEPSSMFCSPSAIYLKRRVWNELKEELEKECGKK
jgi:hypothetical protein